MKFDFNKEKNLANQRKDRTYKIYLEDFEEENEDEYEYKIFSTLKNLYERQ